MYLENAKQIDPLQSKKKMITMLSLLTSKHKKVNLEWKHGMHFCAAVFMDFTKWILQISLHGLRPSSPFQKDFEVRCIREERVFLGLPNGTQLRGESFQTQATKSFYSTFVKSTEQSVSPGFTNNQSCQNESDYLECNFSDVWSSSNGMINETVPLGRVEVKYVEDSSTAVAEEGFTNLKELSSQPADILSGPIEPETISTTDIMASSSDSLDAYKDPLFNKKTSIEDFLDGASKSFSTSINKGESALKSSVDAINASISSVIKNATDAVDNAVGGVFSTADQNRELAGNSLTSFSGDLKEAISKASVVAADVLRRTIVTVEDYLKDGASFVVYSYGSTKELLPPDIRDALNLSEERAIDVLRPVRTIFQQVFSFFVLYTSFIGFFGRVNVITLLRDPLFC